MCEQIFECEVVHTKICDCGLVFKIPPRVMHGGINFGARNAGGRNSLANKDLRALQRQIGVLQEELRRGFNLRRGESDDEGEVEDTY